MTINLITALFLAIGGFCLGLREILLDPKNSTFPCAPKSVRLAMFLGALAMAFLAVRFFLAGDRPFAGDAANVVAGVAGVLAIYKVVMLANLLGQRLPVGVWPRLERIEDHARAAKKAPMRERSRAF